MSEPGIAADTLVGRFRVLRFLGRGATGEVFLARDQVLGRKVALKLLSARGDAMDSLLREARTTARFAHPHIVTVYEVGEHEGRPWLALEYVEGGTLRDRLRKGRPAPRESLRIALAIAQALREAHRHLVLHRDLKPGNVLMARDGRLRVADFGLAVSAIASDRPPPSVPEPRAFAISVSRTCGTPGYMAPEQWTSGDVSGATDVWALGVVLYEMLAGHRPFDGDSDASLALQTCQAPPAPRPEELQGVPAPVAALIARCLEKDPRDRPTAEQVVERLEALLAGPLARSDGEEECPFRGLFPFGEEHAHLFFGRDAECDELIERLRHAPVMPIVGPSGAGKSSFVMAGLVPRLKETGAWHVLVMRPGAHPFETLAARLEGPKSRSRAPSPAGSPARSRAPSRSEDETVSLGAHDGEEVQAEPEVPTVPQLPAIEGAPAQTGSLAERLRDSPRTLNLELQRLSELLQAKVLLFVDQLEELHALVDDPEERRRFMLAICAAADDEEAPVRVVFTLRDDFLGSLAVGREAREALGRLQVVRGPDREALEQILTRPLAVAGYAFDDPTLAAQMLDAVRGESASLPILQFALRALWDRRDRARKLLCRSSHDAMGGVLGAFAEHADGVLRGLSPAQAQIARQLLLRLISPEGTRRASARRALLDGLPAEAEGVLDRLVQARIVTAGAMQAAPDDSASASGGGDAGGADGAGELALELVHESLVRTWTRLARWLDESRVERAFLGEIEQAAALWERRGERDEEVWQGAALADALRRLDAAPVPPPARVRRFVEAGRRRDARRTSRLRLATSGALALSAALAAVFYVQKQTVQQRADEVQREAARAALLRGDFVEARARVRGSLERQDTAVARALWWRLRMEPLVFKADFGAGVYDVAVAPDGASMAVAGSDRAVYLIDTRTAARRVLRGHEEQVQSVAFSPDGKQLASADRDGAIFVRDLGADTARACPKAGVAMRDLAWGPAGAASSTLAAAGYDGTLRLYDARDCAPLGVRAGHTGPIASVAFAPDGATVATAGFDATVRLWDLAAKAPTASTAVLQGHVGAVYAVAFDPGGKSLVTGGADRRVRVWSVATRAIERTLAPLPDEITALALAPDGQTLVVGLRDHSVRALRLSDGGEQRALIGHGDWIRNVAFAPGGGKVASASFDGSVRLWNLGAAPEPSGHAGHVGTVDFAVFSPDGKRLASSGFDDASVRLWDARRGLPGARLRGHAGPVEALAFSPDGKRLASASYDRTARVFDLDGVSAPVVLAGHDDRLLGVAFSGDGASLLAWGYGKEIALWDPIAGARRGGVRGLSDGICQAAFSADGAWLATGGFDHVVRLWSTATWTETRHFDGHAGDVWGLGFARRGAALVSSDGTGELRAWDLASGEGRLIGKHAGRASWLGVHPDGLHVATSGSDGVARIWDLDTGKYVALVGHRGEVNNASFSPDGAQVVTSSTDGTVRLWSASTGRPVWRAPALLAQPPRLRSHRGWTRLDEPDAAAEAAPAIADELTRALDAIERPAAHDAASDTVCLRGEGGRLERWSATRGARLSAYDVAPPGDAIDEIVAMPSACLARVGPRAVLCADERPCAPLAPERVTAIARDDAGFLVAGGDAVVTFDARGVERSRRPIEPGAVALARIGDRLAAGYAEGGVSLLPDGEGAHDRGLMLQDAPSSRPIAMRAGPAGTLIVGYANGALGLWSAQSGERLLATQLHGAVVHLLLEGGRLFAASELGDALTLDLRPLEQPYCDLLKEIWREVPVVYEGGRAIARTPPADHRCAR
jgi:WD40 repeat protein